MNRIKGWGGAGSKKYVETRR